MNKKMIYIILVLILAGFIIAYFTRSENSPASEAGYFISTQGQSDDRVKSLNLDKPSEDASYILDINKLSFPKNEPERVEYKADPEMEWVINVNLLNGSVIRKVELLELFGKDTGFTVYGHEPTEGWTYVMAGKLSETYDKVQIGIDLIHQDNATDQLQKHITRLNKIIKNASSKLSLEPAEPINSAIEKSKKFAALKNEGFGQEAVIILQSEKPFNGLTAWDALTCTGLKWGDGDLFHWNNNTNYGHDQHFSVWTSTYPGYFLPENVLEMNPADLAFGFSIARSADPKNVYAAMIETVKYCQKRLGGTILNGEGQPFDEVKEKERLGSLVDKMRSKGIVPGADKALRMF